ncbi:MAG: hypothetical protein COB17_00010 [Sulfurimonas sp.]|nr:MAG: hypothetical protein COB17_10260 [Sulfurimonas sp.]PHS59586.1 MAG: hypothetical protein COB17_00010 [Sulfurimonas sp.]
MPKEIKKLEEGYKPRTVQYILGLAIQVINHAITYDLITNYTNPISKIRVLVELPFAFIKKFMKYTENKYL